MAVKIRLARTGRREGGLLHVVVADSKMPRDGRCALAYIPDVASQNWQRHNGPSSNPPSDLERANQNVESLLK